jgi:hypothetical protein
MYEDFCAFCFPVPVILVGEEMHFPKTEPLTLCGAPRYQCGDMSSASSLH